MHRESSRGVRVNFDAGNQSWGEKARRGELAAVLSPDGNERRNLFLHTLSLYGAGKALALRQERGVLLDFGCGTGRMLRFFGAHGWSVIGTEITAEMLDEARSFGLPAGAELYLTDGVALPSANQSVDMIWVSGVLKLSLFPPEALCRGGSVAFNKQAENVRANRPFMPVYRDIAREMYRVLKPGGCVVNDEIYVDAPPEVFTRDFEEVGFVTEDIRVLHRYRGGLERWLQSSYVPRWCSIVAARLDAAARFRFDSPRREIHGLRDYLFVWRKAKA